MTRAADPYDEARPGLGDDYLSAVETAIGTITQAPHRWPSVDRRHHRFVLRRFPFSIFYRFSEDEVLVVAVAHHRRAPGYWAHRL